MPMLAVLVRSWALCSLSWALLGSLLPGRLESALRCYLGDLGTLLGSLLAALAALGASVGYPERLALKNAEEQESTRLP